MTEAEITERQVLRVRELTNMTNEQISRIYIMELLKTMYPSEAAEYLVKVVQHYEEKSVKKLRRHLTAKTICVKCGQFVDVCACQDIIVSANVETAETGEM